MSEDVKNLDPTNPKRLLEEALARERALDEILRLIVRLASPKEAKPELVIAHLLEAHAVRQEMQGAVDDANARLAQAQQRAQALQGKVERLNSMGAPLNMDGTEAAVHYKRLQVSLEEALSILKASGVSIMNVWKQRIDALHATLKESKR